MKLKENMVFISILVVVILVTFKIWIKFTFEIQRLGLIVLIAISWTLKYFILKKIKARAKAKKELENKKED